MKKNVQNINNKKRKNSNKQKNVFENNNISKSHAHSRKKDTDFCEECGGQMHDETYGWHPELRNYFLVGKGGKLLLDQPLDDRYVEDDVREFIAMKKKFG
jgi:hypothetical protein